MTTITGIVLAGGKSSRLGENKAFLEVGGGAIITRVFEALKDLCEEVIISANNPERYSDFPYRVIPDSVPQGGALVGLHSSLTVARTDLAFVVACDMPFLSRGLIRHMMDNVESCDAFVPVVNEYLEPLHAIYSRRCLDAIEKHIDMKDRHLRSFYDDVNVGYLDEDAIRKFTAPEKVFFNVNTPEDLQKARTILSTEKAPQR